MILHSHVTFIWHTQQKLKAIQTYLAEFLSQQHEILIDTIDQMEKDANEKISLLEGKLTASLKMTKVSEPTSHHWLEIFTFRIMRISVRFLKEVLLH